MRLSSPAIRRIDTAKNKKPAGDPKRNAPRRLPGGKGNFSAAMVVFDTKWEVPPTHVGTSCPRLAP